MKSWIFSLVIISIIISVFSVILPKNKNGNFVKSIFHVIIVFIVVNPFLKGDFSFENISNIYVNDVDLQVDFITNINNKKINLMNVDCVNLLAKNGIENAEIDILYIEDQNQKVLIQKVKVNLQNSVIKIEEQNINIIERTKSLICNHFSITKDVVEVYVE